MLWHSSSGGSRSSELGFGSLLGLKGGNEERRPRARSSLRWGLIQQGLARTEEGNTPLHHISVPRKEVKRDKNRHLRTTSSALTTLASLLRASTSSLPCQGSRAASARSGSHQEKGTTPSYPKVLPTPRHCSLPPPTWGWCLSEVPCRDGWTGRCQHPGFYYFFFFF